MPLLDHFGPPLHPRRHWESFLTVWAVSLADMLNQDWLPKECYAEVQKHVGMHLEADLVALRTAPDPLPAALTLRAVFPDTFEVRVFGNLPGGLELVAAIELVSPGNKGRPEERRAFAIKAASYLCQGISLIIVDIVTTGQANLHNEMMGLLQAPEASRLAPDAGLYAVAYRPMVRQEKPEIDVWPSTFALGTNLPMLPLGLTHGLCVPVDFETTYVETCRRLRLL